MAVAVGHKSSAATASGGGTSLSWSHTATGDNLLLVCLAFRVNPTSPSCSYNSVDMGAPIVNGITGTGGDGSIEFLYVFKLVSPATGANTIAIAWTGTQKLAAGGISFSGANGGAGTPVTQQGASVLNGNTTPWTQAVNIVTGDIALGAFAVDCSAASLSTTNTEQIKLQDANTYVSLIVCSQTGNGSVSLNALTGEASAAGIAAIPIVASAPSAIKAVSGVAYASILKVSGVAKASIKKIAGLA